MSWREKKLRKATSSYGPNVIVVITCAIRFFVVLIFGFTAELEVMLALMDFLVLI